MNKQLTEDYVSFEIAKLLKEKGFNEPCLSYFWSLENGASVDYCDTPFTNKQLYSGQTLRPTHQMALKWLREVHRKHICVRMRDFPTQYEIEVYDTKTGYLCHADFEHSFDSYEEACEAALKYTLENLI